MQEGGQHDLETDSPATGKPDYMEGMCHVLAVALHRRLGHAFLLLLDERERYGSVPAVVHVYAVDADGMAHDLVGSRPVEEVVSQWMSPEGGGQPGCATIETEPELQDYVSDDWSRPLEGYCDADVYAAWEVVAARFPGEPRDLQHPGGP